MIFEHYDIRAGNVADFAFGGADGKIGIRAAGDLHDFAALERGAHIHGGHGAVQINVAVVACTFDASRGLRFAIRRDKEKKACS